MKEFKLNQKTSIVAPEKLTQPIEHVLSILSRDINKIAGYFPVWNEQKNNNEICLSYFDGGAESWRIEVQDNNVLQIFGADDLGLIYGVLHFSRKYLGVDPFWFWADKEPESQSEIIVSQEIESSQEKPVKNRGWFVNDEQCLIDWNWSFPHNQLHF